MSVGQGKTEDAAEVADVGAVEAERRDRLAEVDREA